LRKFNIEAKNIITKQRSDANTGADTDKETYTETKSILSHKVSTKYTPESRGKI